MAILRSNVLYPPKMKHVVASLEIRQMREMGQCCGDIFRDNPGNRITIPDVSYFPDIWIKISPIFVK